MIVIFFFFFFFQAEDGIRDLTVTGVQTCALPILETEVGSGSVEVRDIHGPAKLTTGSGGISVANLREDAQVATGRDRKSTRLNSSHSQISYAVFCLKKKKQTKHQPFDQLCMLSNE